MSRDFAVGIACFAAAAAFLVTDNSGIAAMLIAVGVVLTSKDMRRKDDSD